MNINVDDFVMGFLLTLDGTCRSDASIQPDERDALWAAYDLGYIAQDIDMVGNLVYRLTDAGRTVMLAGKRSLDEKREQTANEEAKEKAKREDIARQRTQDRRDVYLASVLGAAVGSIVTLLVEHFGEIIQLIKHLAGG